MENLFNVNGLVFWDEEEIRLRSMFEEHFVFKIRDELKMQNRAFEFFKCEASLLTPIELINPNYTSEDIWIQAEDGQEFTEAFNVFLKSDKMSDVLAMSADKISGDELALFMAFSNTVKTGGEINAKDYLEALAVFSKLFPQKSLVLRPETTMGSYIYAKHLLNQHNERKVKPPLVVYQHGKSFRREQDQVQKNMRLKEFYQLEFQIIYSTTTKNDYSLTLIPAVKEAIASMIGPCRIEDSDRLPDYAEWTKDIICEKTNMEVCSISKRKDFDGMIVLEVAIGTDRCVFNFKNKD